MVKFYSKESNLLAMHAIPGHFATSHSHINYYVDVTSLKTRAGEAKEAAKVLYSRMPRAEYVDTIVCMDGTEVVGAFLSQEIENGGVLSTNRHETIYVVTPEFNSNNQMLFRDNNKGAIAGKHVILLLATTTTGETIRRSLECIRYYGGIVEGVASLFSTVKSVDGVEVEALFDKEDITGYEAYSAQDCPFCKKGQKIEPAIKNEKLLTIGVLVLTVVLGFAMHCLPIWDGMPSILSSFLRGILVIAIVVGIVWVCNRYFGLFREIDKDASDSSRK